MNHEICCRCEVRAQYAESEICDQCAQEICLEISVEVESAYRWLARGSSQRVARPPRLTSNPQILMWLKGLINGR